MQNPDGPHSNQIQVMALMNQRFTRECLAMVLAHEGMRVTAAEPDLASFVRSLGEHPSDEIFVVLLDSAALLASLPDRSDVRPIIVSGFDEPRLRDECLRAGAWGCVDLASAAVAQLVSIVRTVGEGSRGALPASEPAEDEGRSGVGASLVAELTLRERQVFEHVAAGEDNLKIASLLGISERTVKAHVSSLYRKLGQENRAQLALLARQLGVRPSSEPTAHWASP